jgi:hypothetical protein
MAEIWRMRRAREEQVVVRWRNHVVAAVDAWTSEQRLLAQPTDR